MSAPVPRPVRLARSLARDQNRIRRLEIDGNAGKVVCGVAGYQMVWTGLTAEDTFTPDLSTLAINGAVDTIGCTPQTTHLQIPAGWMWQANLVLKVKTSAPPPTGEALVWSALNRWGLGSVRSDVMVDSSSTAQRFGAIVVGASGGDYDGVYLPEFLTLLGTTFVPTQLDISVTALSPFACGFTGGAT